MKKIVFGGIYIFSGLLFAIILNLYGFVSKYGEINHPLGLSIFLSIISVVVGVIYTIIGLREE